MIDYYMEEKSESLEIQICCHFNSTPNLTCSRKLSNLI